MGKHQCSGKRLLWFFGLVICGAGIVVLLLTVGRDWLDGMKSARTEEQTRALYTVRATLAAPAPSETPAPQPTATPTPTPSPQPMETPAYPPSIPPTATLPPVQADFEELYAKNERLIGWLTAGERIDYPVTWYEGDNSYYLDHDFFNRADANGTLFLNGHNSFIPRDDVWLIHGHNMKSGAMFGTLCRFRDYRYVCEYPLVEFRTIYDAEMVYYVPIAGFDASMLQGSRDYFDITQIVFPNDDEAAPTIAAAAAQPVAAGRQSAAFQYYLDSLLKKSLWQSPVDVSVDDSLLMLVTCSYLQTDGRFMLVCRKLRADETAESVAALFQQE